MKPQPKERVEPVYAGCDLGIATVKVALVTNDRIIAWDVLPYTNLPREAAEELFERVLAGNNLSPKHVAGHLATGLGATFLPFPHDPQIIGAVGAAVLAGDMISGKRPA